MNNVIRNYSWTGDLDPVAVPVELGIQVLDPNEAPGQAEEPGETATPAPSAALRRARGPTTPATAAGPASRSSSRAWPAS